MLLDRDLMERQLVERIGPILSDGTPVSSLIDLEQREVSLRVYHDPEIHRLELSLVHARTWHMLAHEAEIPASGDFVLRYIGEDAVIVTRDRDGGIHALLNVCAHRGMRVCAAEQGNQSHFKCPYHGWTYNSGGKLVGTPFEREMYGDWDKSRYGLRTARVASRHGVIFGCFDAETPALDEWLGDMGYYFDQVYGREELDVFGPISRRIVRSNWKVGSEQVSGDAFHTATLHRALGDLGFINADPSDAKGWAVDIVKVGVPQGHSLYCTEVAGSMYGNDNPRSYIFDGYFVGGNLFPCSTVVMNPFPKADMSGMITTAAIGGFVPRGADQFEQWFVQVGPKGTSEEEKKAYAKATSVNNALIISDDFEAYEAVQQATRGAVSQTGTIKYNTLSGPNRPEDWPGPGDVYAGISKDDSQWQFWLRWLDMMTTPRDIRK